ncbi:MFS transporter [Virgibacillus siamensis]|uniref:MFS transporter n=1 Tax=Virgibacillus siamensis TaxID=480071 RepID=UPI0009849D5E|nr:MFS transporter [Virgibacillus siamensis]
MSESNKKIHYAWWVLLGVCIFVGLGKGALNNVASLFLTPITEDLGVGMGELTLYFSVSAVITMVFLPIGGKLMAKFNTRLVLIVAVILQAGAFALFGVMQSVWGWYLMAIPLAVGGVFITVIAGPVLINQWFKKKNGLALGILSAAGGAVGAIAQPVVGGLIAGQGWRTSYFIVGLAVMIIAVPIIFLIVRQSPEEMGLQPYGMEETEQGGNDKHESGEQGVTMAAAKKSSAFYLLVVFFFFVTSIASFSMHIPTYLINKGFDVTFAGNVMGLFMTGVLVGSLVIGMMIDKIGSRNTALFTMVIGILAICMLLFLTYGFFSIGLAVGLLGVVSASIGTLGPALTTALFGNKEYSQIYSTASLGLAISSIVALPAYGFIYDFTGSYTTALYAILIMFICNIACVIAAFKGKNKLQQKGFWTSNEV